MTKPTPRIGLIVPASNTVAEVQFQRYAPAGVGVHTTRLRMTGQWSRPLRELADDITQAAAALSDTSPGVIVFHCTANSMAEGQAGETVDRSTSLPSMIVEMPTGPAVVRRAGT